MFVEELLDLWMSALGWGRRNGKGEVLGVREKQSFVSGVVLMALGP
jgi:hypothetical protein